MWRLIKTELRYRRGVIVAAYGLVAVLSTILVVTPPETGERRELLPVLGIALFAMYLVIIGTMVAADRRERRLRLHLLLPVTVTEIGLARLLGALLVGLIGLGLGVVFVAVAWLLGERSITFKAILVINAMIVFAGQGFFLIEEARVRSSKWAYLLLLLWLLIIFMMVIVPPPETETEDEQLPAAFQRLLDTPLRQLALYLAVPATVALNLCLFVRRRQWLG